MRKISQRRAKKIFGDSLVLWVDPTKINSYSGTAKPFVDHFAKKLAASGSLFRLARKILYPCEPFIIPGQYFRQAVPVETIERYKKLQDIIANRENTQQSLWSKLLHDQLKKSGVAKHKAIRMYNAGDINEFMDNYVLDLINTLERYGYDSTKTNDCGHAQIDDMGRLIKSTSGVHRFCAARILKVERFPIRVVGVHEKWLDLIGVSNCVVSSEHFKSALKNVEFKHQS